MNETTEVFWEFSLKVWKNEELRDQLLSLQEQNDLDINLCLFLLWTSTLGLVLCNAESKVKQHQNHWLNQTIKPIRAVRIVNREQPQLKQCLLAAELEAEKLYQEALCQLHSAITLKKAPADYDIAATLKANLGSHIKTSWDTKLIALMIKASQ